jgi:hypothetical protein
MGIKCQTMFMQSLLHDNENVISNENEYHDISDRLRKIDRSIIQLILIKEEYERMIKEYLRNRDQMAS